MTPATALVRPPLVRRSITRKMRTTQPLGTSFRTLSSLTWLRTPTPEAREQLRYLLHGFLGTCIIVRIHKYFKLSFEHHWPWCKLCPELTQDVPRVEESPLVANKLCIHHLARDGTRVDYDAKMAGVNTAVCSNLELDVYEREN